MKMASADHKEIVNRTLAYWDSRTSSRLNAEDARQVIENITGFFSQLDAWDNQVAAQADAQLKQKSKITEIPVIGRDVKNGLAFKRPKASAA